jgi:hypothetical protein
MKRDLLVVWAVVLLCAGAPAAAAANEIERTMVEELLRLTKVEENQAAILGQMEKFIADQYAAIDAPEADKERIAKFHKRTFDLVMDEMRWDRLKEDFVDLYVKVFTQEELAGMITFYRTPAGQALVTKLPLLMQEMMTISQSRMQSLMPRIEALVKEAVEDEEPSGDDSAEDTP